MTAPPSASRKGANRAEKLLLPATFITCLGNSIQLTAASLLVVQAERTALSVGWLFIAVAIPQVLLSVWFGRLADRFDRRLLCLLCDLLSMLAALALPVWLLLDGPTGTAVYVTNFALSLVAALFMPASNALIKERVRPERIGRFNAAYEVATQAGTLISASVGGFLVQLFGTQPLFFFNGLTFLASALCWLLLGRRPHTTPDQAPAAGGGPAAEAAATVPRRAPLARLGLLYALGNVVITASNTLIVVLVVQGFHQKAGVLGVVDALAGVGFTVAAVLYARFSVRIGNLGLALLGYLGCAGLITLEPLFGVGGLMLLLPCGALTFGLARISARTLLLTEVEDRRAGSVFGATNAFGLAISAGATLGLSVLSDHSRIRNGYFGLAVLIGGAAALTVLSLRGWNHRRKPAAEDSADPALEPAL
ncbi:MFS transporter [Kitasatospora sp. NPDC088134]|uniref:MFS transporter n=1 Tax=Kitasatospora sp. NPDC088134 TaxID=3364071 RepID=UPI0037F19F97